MPTGYPVRTFQKRQFEHLCALQCTENEIATHFGIGVTKLVELVKENYEGKTFQEVRPLLAEAGKVSLRRSQFRIARRNPTMAIWLGKNILGQKEPKQELDLSAKVDQTVKTEGPVELIVMAVHPGGKVEPAGNNAHAPHQNGTATVSNGNGAQDAK